ncbi:hypothetical protein C4D60_Mb02t11030 [Musa balbisiana]|uniref:Serine-threonine/tyrosine-protein kinase catalytic domain-containing protein n=1 Tax=Musa balbisiana TaxID=52838 RepID=A0A4V4H2L0_MUSBA|nr:hypothetical protein C4D60_Mb02t11030 [Musa balbisiana]
MIASLKSSFAVGRVTREEVAVDVASSRRQEPIDNVNEVATINRIHHVNIIWHLSFCCDVNVIQLLGFYCDDKL